MQAGILYVLWSGMVYCDSFFSKDFFGQNIDLAGWVGLVLLLSV
jgi:multidrug transporter EmrE-like cation transporter